MDPMSHITTPNAAASNTTTYMLDAPANEMRAWMTERLSSSTSERYIETIFKIYQHGLDLLGEAAPDGRRYSLNNLFAMEHHEAFSTELFNGNARNRRAMDMLMTFALTHELHNGSHQDPIWHTVVQPRAIDFTVWLGSRCTKLTARRYVRFMERMDTELNTSRVSFFAPQRFIDLLRNITGLDIEAAGRVDALYKRRVIRDMLDAFCAYLGHAAYEISRHPAAKQISAARSRAKSVAATATKPAPTAEAEGEDSSQSYYRVSAEGFKAWLTDVLSSPQIIRNYATLVDEAGNFAVEKFGCTHLYKVHSLREGRRVLNLLRLDAEGYERYFRMRVSSRVFRRYEEYMVYVRDFMRTHHSNNNTFPQTGNTPHDTTDRRLERFQAWAGREITGKVMKNYISILKTGADYARARYGDFTTATSFHEAARIINDLKKDTIFGPMIMPRVTQRRAYDLYLQFMRMMDGGKDTLDQERLSGIRTDWQPYARWMKERRYTINHIKRIISALTQLESYLGSFLQGKTLTTWRDIAALGRMKEDLLQQAPPIKKTALRALDHFFYYLQDVYSNSNILRKPLLVMGNYASISRAFRAWLVEAGIKKGAERNYVSGLRDLGSCLADEKAFFEATTLEEVIRLKERCEQTEIYGAWSSQMKDFPKQAYNWFMDFLTAHTLTSAVDVQDLARQRESALRRIIMEKYSGCIPSRTAKVCGELANHWESMYSEYCPLTLNEIKRILFVITVTDDGPGCYLPEAVISDAALDRITAFIATSFESGVFSIYYESVLNELAPAFPELNAFWRTGRVNLFRDSLRLRVPLLYTYGSKALKPLEADEDAYIPALPDIICTFVREQGRTVTLREIEAHLPQVAPSIISRICKNREGVAADVLMCPGKDSFCHVDTVHVSPEEWARFAAQLDAMTHTKPVSQNELYHMIKTSFPDWFSDNPIIDSPVVFFKYVRRRLNRTFSFTRTFIFPLGAATQTVLQNFSEHCANLNYTFSYAELKEMLKSYHPGMLPFWETIYEGSARVSSDSFVARDTVSFDIPATDAVIADLCTEPITPIRALIPALRNLPPASHMWTIFLLEQFIYSFSKRFKLVHSRFGADVKGFIVPRSATHIDDFEEALAQHLAATRVALTEASVMLYISYRGIAGAIRYPKLARVLARARDLRAQAEATSTPPQQA